MKNPFRQVSLFVNETIGELKKAVWPTQKEMRRYVGVVLVGMVLLGVYVSVVDFSLLHVVDLFSNWVRGSFGS
jgi:preprotein translocase SecE subunit